MEHKDLKNSEELYRQPNDESELVDEMNTEDGSAASAEAVPESDKVEESSNQTSPDQETVAVVSEHQSADDVLAEPESEVSEATLTEAVQESEPGPEPDSEPVQESEPEIQAESSSEDLPASVEEDLVENPDGLEVKEINIENTVLASDTEEPSAMQDRKAEEEIHNEPEEDVEGEDDETAGEEADDEMFDYSGYSQVELVNTLRDLVEGDDSSVLAERRINLIVAAFNRKVKDNLLEHKNKFMADGGSEDEFQIEEDPYENDIRELLKKHRQSKFEQAKKMEVEKEANLQRKYSIIEEIKNLLNTEESINRTFQEFRELQKEWYDIGPVPQSKMKDLWDTYHFHVENFYDYIKINKELRDLDLKKNLEAKISLCEKTEELLLEPSVIRAFNTLQKYHEQWREIGPVPRDKKDEIWERFKAVTTQINQKHQEFFERRKVEQKKNLEAKIALCEKAEEIVNGQLDSHREWDEKSKELIELQKLWRTIGFAPKRDNNRIYDRFRNACDQFFNKKREYYSMNKELQNKNMQLKIDLCLEAESLKDNTDWKKTTQQFIDIQKRWKEIGPVPRKHSDTLWKRFRAACDYFFEHKSLHFNDIDDEQVENLQKKIALIEEVEIFIPGNDVPNALKVLREFQRRWTEIGHVPIKDKDSVQNRFRTAINKHFDDLKLDSGKRDSLKFRNKIATLTENQKGLSKIRQEREKYMIKLKQLENDLTLLDNNIGFFANSKNAQALIADVNQKIEDTREKIEMLKEKIRIIDDLDKAEY